MLQAALTTDYHDSNVDHNKLVKALYSAVLVYPTNLEVMHVLFLLVLAHTYYKRGDLNNIPNVQQVLEIF